MYVNGQRKSSISNEQRESINCHWQLTSKITQPSKFAFIRTSRSTGTSKHSTHTNRHIHKTWLYSSVSSLFFVSPGVITIVRSAHCVITQRRASCFAVVSFLLSFFFHFFIQREIAVCRLIVAKLYHMIGNGCNFKN